MCGRYTLRTPANLLIEHFALERGALAQLVSYLPRFNVAPTQTAPVIRRGDPPFPRRRLAWMRWGLIPSWSKQFASARPLINARSETVAEKASFRTSFRRRRCLIPADGFYEWRAMRGRKQPYYIRRADARPFAFAGLWDAWHGSADGQPPLETCVILTASANRVIAPLHDRMPVILAPHDYDRWLADDGAPLAEDEVRRLLAPLSEDELIADPVSTRVNQASCDDAQCIVVADDLLGD
jgi:putative SOS response-associated peptidase YedK